MISPTLSLISGGIAGGVEATITVLPTYAVYYTFRNMLANWRRSIPSSLPRQGHNYKPPVRRTPLPS